MGSGYCHGKGAAPQDAPVPLPGSASEHGRTLAMMLATALSRLQQHLPWSLCSNCAGARERHDAAHPPGGQEAKGLMLEVEGDQGQKVFETLYDVGEYIGEGAFGKVYACRRRPGVELRGAPHDEPTCVKMVPTSGKHGNRGSKILQEEMKIELLRLFELLQHPNIVRYHRFVLTRDMLYIVMSRCEGPGLMDYIEASGMLLPADAASGPSARRLARQMLGALAAVHAIGMMHRDVKPDNFRFKDHDAESLQLLDFGAAKPDAGASPAAHSVTGTLLFAAPEVFDAFYCRSCDLWSVGVVFFLLVCGHAPFETSDVTMLRSMHRDPVLTGDSLLRGEQWKKAPHGARELTRGLLTVDPSRRPSAVAALQLPWLAEEGSQADVESDLDGSRSHPLVKSSSRSASIAEMKRSYFVWNLADCTSSDDEDNPSALAPRESPQPFCREELAADVADDGEVLPQGAAPSRLPSTTADSTDADGSC